MTSLLEPTAPAATEFDTHNSDGPIRLKRAPKRRRPNRRPGLPTGRAVVGGLLVSLAALALFWVWQEASTPPETTFVVAARDLAVGETLAIDDLRVIKADLPADVAQRVIQSPDVLINATTLGPLAEGELVQVSSVLGAASRNDAVAGHELSFAISRNRAVGGRLRAGETVDVLATFGSTNSETRWVVRNVAVSRTQDLGTALGSTGTIELTVILENPADVLTLAEAIDTAEVTVVRATRADDDADEALAEAEAAEASAADGTQAEPDADTDIAETGEINESSEDDSEAGN